MPRGKPLNAIDANQIFRLVAEGKTLSEIATIVGVTYSGLHRKLTETWPDEYAEAKQRRDDMIRNRVWDIGMEPAITTKNGDVAEVADTQSMRWALDHLIKWHLPEARETQRLEIGGTVQIEHSRRLTLADLIQPLGDVKGLEPGARGELPAAGEILAED